MTTKKAKRKSARDLNIYAFCRKIQWRASGQEESDAGVTYLSMRIHPKSCRIVPLKVPTTLLSGSRKSAVVSLFFYFLFSVQIPLRLFQLVWILWFLWMNDSILNAAYAAVSLGDILGFQHLTFITKYSGIIQDLYFIDLDFQLAYVLILLECVCMCPSLRAPHPTPHNRPALCMHSLDLLIAASQFSLSPLILSSFCLPSKCSW